MLLKTPADSVMSNVMPDGGEAQAVFQPGSFGDRWPSKTEVTMTILLSSHVLDLRVSAKNVGTEAEPFGIGWHPRFAIPSGDRGQVTLRMPTGDRMERRGSGGVPTGRLLPVAGTAFDFTPREGSRFSAAPMDESFVHLRPAILDFGPRGGAARSEEQLPFACDGDDSRHSRDTGEVAGRVELRVDRSTAEL